MTEKVNLREKVLALTISTLLLIGAPVTHGIVRQNHYNSLPSQEKIEFLENYLTLFKYPPSVPGARGGGGALIAWSQSKKYIQEELERLRNYELEK